MVNIWGILWREKNRLDGETQHLMWESGRPLIFHTRRDARLYIELNYGYIRNRLDLRVEPHGWKLPIPVKVKIEVVK